FGFERKNLPRSLSLALGTATASPLDICTGYATFANGGYKVNPYIVQRLVDSQNKVVYEANPPTACAECQRLSQEEISPFADESNAIDQLVRETDTQEITAAKQVITPQTAYIMTSLLQDAIQTGTAKLAKELHRSDLAGKTGTTNNQMDAWFTGYNQSLVAS